MASGPIDFCVSERNLHVRTSRFYCLRSGEKLCLYFCKFFLCFLVFAAVISVLFHCAVTAAQAGQPAISGKAVYVCNTAGDDAWDGLASGWDGIHGPKKTIQAGIDGSTKGDIVIVADGTYRGFGNRDLDFGGKAIILRSENGAGSTIIDCEGIGRGFYFHSHEEANSVVDGFTIHSGSARRGGGIIFRNNSCPTIANCVIMGNFAGDGGGIYCRNNSMPTLINCSIAGNFAGDGGGIYCRNNSIPTFINCSITANSAYGDGGGIFCRNNSMPTLVNCMIVSNSSDGDGGGIFCRNNSMPRLVNCTIMSNSAVDGGGIYCGRNSRPKLVNCILWDDSPEEIHVKKSSSPKLIYCDIQGGWSGAGMGNISEDPLLTADRHLRAGSACIDAGTFDGAPSDDIDGEVRPYGAGIDIGADEFVSSDPVEPGGVKLFWQSSSGRVAYWLLNSDGTLRSSGRIAEGVLPTERVIRASGDIDRDGITDLIWQADDGSVSYWLLNLNGTLKSSGHIINGSVSTGWVIRFSGDIDRDGTTDLIWHSNNGGVACWLLNADGTLGLSKRIIEDCVPIEWSISASGDIDRDGTVDLIWQANDGNVAYWLLNSDGSLKSSGRIIDGYVSTGWIIRASGDIDRDGTIDLIWQTNEGDSAYWLLNVDGTLKSSGRILGIPVSSKWVIRASGDIDQDGTTDLIWQADDGSVAYWMLNMDGTLKSSGSVLDRPVSTEWIIRASGL